MLTFATVNWRNYEGRGVEYANILFDSIRRNLKEGTPGKFVVFTDNVTEPGYDPDIELRQLPYGLDGWYNKIALFQDNAFEYGDKVLYFDLDTVITGPLDDLINYDGYFAILRDVYRPDGLQSSVMMWEHGEFFHVWEGYKAFGYPKFENGDQEWIERSIESPVIIQRLFPGKFVSYKCDARWGVPPGVSVVFFHGHPRPHECDGWVKHVWKLGGCTSAQLELVGNADGDMVKNHIIAAENMPHTAWLKPIEPHDGVALICAGGPSLRDEIPSIQVHKSLGGKIFGCNGSPHALWQHSLETDFHVIVDARPENLRFTEALSPDAVCLYASQCHPSLHDKMRDKLILWHPAIDGIVDLVGKDKERAFVGGGTTCGMKAAVIAWILGYRTIHLFGFDSCYRDGKHHAYPQSLNDGEQVIDVEFDGKAYKCAPWMIQQAEDFESFAPQLMDHGVTLHVHGTGLIPDIAKQFSKGIYRPEAADFRAQGILEKLEGVKSPQVAEIGVFAGDLSRRLLARRPDLKLLMIDSWTANHADQYTASDDFHTSLSQEAQDKYCELTQKVTSFAGDRAKIIRATSEEAAKQIADNFLDLVFIDADHSYEGCKRDIEAYWGKVKPGGIISGHDYANDAWKFGPMVKKAVDEFIASRSLVLELGPNYTWFTTKPLTPQGNTHE